MEKPQMGKSQMERVRMGFSEELKEKSGYAEAVLKRYLPEARGYSHRVLEAANYSALSGGKRLRPVILREAFIMYGGEGDLAEPFMAALELIHNYSLVHDDLPAMDNDMYRRGKKTTHAVYGAGMATLAGDLMLNLAFETAFKAFEMIPTDISIEEREKTRDGVIRALRILGEKAGVWGMIGGQGADVDAEESHIPMDMERLMYIHENKTAALIECALMVGAALAGADEDELKKLENIGSDIGIAFQIKDDILDVTGDEEKLGKPVGSDKENGKETYVTLCGLEKAGEDQKALSLRAVEGLDSLEHNNSFLRELIIRLIDREA